MSAKCSRPDCTERCRACMLAAEALHKRLDVGGVLLMGFVIGMETMATDEKKFDHLCPKHRVAFDQLTEGLVERVASAKKKQAEERRRVERNSDPTAN